MSTIEEAFTRILGTQPTDGQRQTLLRTRDALNLKNNDALWLVLIALGHYETLYARFPEISSRVVDRGLIKRRPFRPSSSPRS